MDVRRNVISGRQMANSVDSNAFSCKPPSHVAFIQRVSDSELYRQHYKEPEPRCHFVTGGKVAVIPEQSAFLGMNSFPSTAVAVTLVSNLQQCEDLGAYSESSIRNMKKASVFCFAIDVNVLKKKQESGRRLVKVDMSKYE